MPIWHGVGGFTTNSSLSSPLLPHDRHRASPRHALGAGVICEGLCFSGGKECAASHRPQSTALESAKAAPSLTQPSPPPPSPPRASALRKRDVALREREAASRESETAVLARESALDASELERAKGASESERARQAQMRATVAGRVEPILENAASVLAAAREREREARMAMAREGAPVAKLEAELAAYWALLPDGKWSSPGASGRRRESARCRRQRERARLTPTASTNGSSRRCGGTWCSFLDRRACGKSQHTQAKPSLCLCETGRCVTLRRTWQFLVFLTFHYTDRSAEPHFSSLIIGVWVQVRAFAQVMSS